MSKDRDKKSEGETPAEDGLEARIQRLEEIVRALESDDLELERALTLFEEGVSHVRTAEKLLAEAELKVEELLGETEDLRTRPLENPHVTLSKDGTVVDRGKGANVLDSPALALVHLARVLAGQPQFPPLAAGEIVTTGTVTDAWPVAAGETWSSDYGDLGIEGLSITFA